MKKLLVATAFFVVACLVGVDFAESASGSETSHEGLSSTNSVFDDYRSPSNLLDISPLLGYGEKKAVAAHTSSIPIASRPPMKSIKSFASLILLIIPLLAASMYALYSTKFGERKVILTPEEREKQYNAALDQLVIAEGQADIYRENLRELFKEIIDACKSHLDRIDMRFRQAIDNLTFSQVVPPISVGHLKGVYLKAFMASSKLEDELKRFRHNLKNAGPESSIESFRDRSESFIVVLKALYETPMRLYEDALRNCRDEVTRLLEKHKHKPGSVLTDDGEPISNFHVDQAHRFVDRANKILQLKSTRAWFYSALGDFESELYSYENAMHNILRLQTKVDALRSAMGQQTEEDNPLSNGTATDNHIPRP